MSRIIRGSRTFALGAAFVMVMAGTGALLGAIVGVVLTLLVQTVMGLRMEVVGLMSTSVALGTLASSSWGVFLMARQVVVFTWQPRLVVAPQPEHKQISS